MTNKKAVFWYLEWSLLTDTTAKIIIKLTSSLAYISKLWCKITVCKLFFCVKKKVCGQWFRSKVWRHDKDHMKKTALNAITHWGFCPKFLSNWPNHWKYIHICNLDSKLLQISVKTLISPLLLSPCECLGCEKKQKHSRKYTLWTVLLF